MCSISIIKLCFLLYSLSTKVHLTYTSDLTLQEPFHLLIINELVIHSHATQQ